MQLYSIKKGYSFFKGNRVQPLFLQIGVLMLGLLMTIMFENWWLIITAIVIFISLNTVSQSETISDSFRIYFFKNCIYNNENKQINCLYGFSEGFFKKNVAFIGWKNIENGEIELFACTSVNGLKSNTSLIKCKPETWIFCNIKNTKYKYIFKILNYKTKSVSIYVDKDIKPLFYRLFKLFIFRLYPSFGENKLAPQDMNLYILKLNME